MLRLVGAALVFIGAGYVGCRAGHDLMTSIRHSQALAEMIKQLELELVFHLIPLPELLLCVGNRTEGALGAFLLRCGRYAQMGDGVFIEHWQQEAQALKSRSDSFSMDCLLRLGQGIGRYDWEEVRQLLLSLEKELELHLEKIEEEYTRKAQVYRTLGASAGAFLVILFL